MTRGFSRRTEVAPRALEIRQRENDAPRLKELVPTLTSLKLMIEVMQGEGVLAQVRHTRHVIVDRAPAVFVIPCAGCRDGIHDFTQDIMRQLRASRTEFRGEDVCGGQQGSGNCARIMRYTAHVEYSA